MNTDVTIGRRTYAVAKSPNTSSCVDALGSYDTRTKRNRRKVHPTRYRGTWVISDNTRAALERCELFQDIDRSQLMAVAALVEECSLTPDEMILGEGEVARYIFVIVEGHAIAQLKLERGWLSLGSVGPNEVASWFFTDGRPGLSGVGEGTNTCAVRAHRDEWLGPANESGACNWIPPSPGI